jgi:HEAT repeat protein
MTQEIKMKTFLKTVLVAATLILATPSTAQEDVRDDAEQIKLSLMELLISAPPERALPLVNKVLSGDHSNELKERALFILSQIDGEDAQSTLLAFASESDGDLQNEAIRMVGISGNKDSLSELKSIYESGGPAARESVLEAFLIAGDKQAVFDIAVNAEGEDFEEAVDMLGAMGARNELRELLSRTGPSETLIDAYAISGDIEELRRMALDGSDPTTQAQAIEAMGIVGGDDVNATLVQIYKDTESELIRDAALDGLMISGDDAGMLELYRATQDPAAKKEMLQYLVALGSEEVWNIIDAALDGDQ